MLNKLPDLLNPLAKLVDDFNLSQEEKLQAKQVMFDARSQLMMELLQYERASLETRAKIVNIEAAGQSWMQRNWRPLTMLTFLVLVVCDSLALLPFRLAKEAWTLLQIGLGGYVVGRSAEKLVTGSAAQALFKKRTSDE